jgi:hypothetical protein
VTTSRTPAGRLPARSSDFAWAAVAVLAAAVVAWAVTARLWWLLGDPGGQRLAVFLLWAGLLLAFGRWIVLGAWLRTVWGAPPGGRRDHLELERLDRDAVTDDGPER